MMMSWFLDSWWQWIGNWWVDRLLILIGMWTLTILRSILLSLERIFRFQHWMWMHRWIPSNVDLRCIWVHHLWIRIHNYSQSDGSWWLVLSYDLHLSPPFIVLFHPPLLTYHSWSIHITTLTLTLLFTSDLIIIYYYYYYYYYYYLYIII